MAAAAFDQLVRRLPATTRIGRHRQLRNDGRR
jgi:hypothetical protein